MTSMKDRRDVIEKNMASVRAGVPLTRKAMHITAAAGRFMNAVLDGKIPLVSKEEREHRLSICRDCKFWAEKGNLGFGECRHPQCGCTRLKQGLSTEHCPLEKWGTNLSKTNPSTKETIP